MSDCGLLCAMGLENIQYDILQGDMSINMGGILENVFAQQLKANGFNLRYFNKHKLGEIDFVIQQNSKVIPIEIKSGKNYKSHQTLNNILNVKDWDLKQGIVFCMNNISKENNIVYLPWYMVMFIKEYINNNLLVDFNIKLDD